MWLLLPVVCDHSCLCQKPTLKKKNPPVTNDVLYSLTRPQLFLTQKVPPFTVALSGILAEQSSFALLDRREVL